MRWRKLGLVYTPKGDCWWARTHAMCPTPLYLGADVVRIFITCLDAQGIGRPGYVDVAAEDPRKVIAVGKEPIFDIGESGTFDDNGALVTSALKMPNGELFFYYAGFELCNKIRYRLLSGLAISSDGGISAKRFGRTPVLERSDDELYFRGGPFALYEEDRVRLWYVAGSEWTDIGNKKAMPVYDLRYLESMDGKHWAANGRIVMRVTGADEHGFGRPWVVQRGAKNLQLYYSIRRRSLAAYRLGYAESNNGLDWQRNDQAMGLDVSAEGFDSDAIMYAAVLSVHGRTYCFYNGNNFGERGFGVAELLE